MSTSFSSRNKRKRGGRKKGPVTTRKYCSVRGCCQPLGIHSATACDRHHACRKCFNGIAVHLGAPYCDTCRLSQPDKCFCGERITRFSSNLNYCLAHQTNGPTARCKHPYGCLEFVTRESKDATRCNKHQWTRRCRDCLKPYDGILGRDGQRCHGCDENKTNRQGERAVSPAEARRVQLVGILQPVVKELQGAGARPAEIFAVLCDLLPDRD